MAEDDEVPVGFDIGLATATPQTWDFSVLESDTLYSVEFYNPTSVDPNGEFPSADLAVNQFGGMAFAEFGSNDVSIIGIIADFGTAMGLPTPLVMAIPMDDPQKIFEFPSSYGTTFIDSASFDVSFNSAGLIPSPINLFWDPDSIRIYRTSNTDATIDAEGVLTDPTSTTHNVLRQFVVDNSIDSIWGLVDSTWEFAPSFPGVFDNPQITVDSSYRYIGQETGYIVADVDVNGDGVASHATFLSDPSLCCTGVEEVEMAAYDLIYPNPTSGIININAENNHTEIKVFDISGRAVFSESLQRNTRQIDLSRLTNGLYLFKLTTENGKVKAGRLSIRK